MDESELEESLVCEGWPINAKQLGDFVGEPIAKIRDVDQLKRQLLDVGLLIIFCTPPQLFFFHMPFIRTQF